MDPLNYFLYFKQQIDEQYYKKCKLIYNKIKELQNKYWLKIIQKTEKIENEGLEKQLDDLLDKI